MQEAGVWIVATLPGDFYGQYQLSPFLRRFGDNGLVNLGQLEAAAIDQIIKCPAELADLSWEPYKNGISLADCLRKGIGDKIDILPLLEVALSACSLISV
ncbi:MAG: hypothetical protein ACRERV_07455 [Methylococcales bacterium]